MLAACVIKWIVSKYGQFINTDAAVHFGLLPRSNHASTSLPPASSGVIVRVLSVYLDTEGAWYSSDISSSDVIDIRLIL